MKHLHTDIRKSQIHILNPTNIWNIYYEGHLRDQQLNKLFFVTGKFKFVK